MNEQHRTCVLISTRRCAVKHAGTKMMRAQAGFSLVELLVGVIIGLLGTIIIFQVFAVSEGQKRTTTSGSDAESNGAFALYSLETNLRQAGNNITNAFPANTTGEPQKTQIAGCAIPATAPYTAVALQAIPLVITDGGGGVSDSITIFTGSAATLSQAVALNGAATAGATSINIQSTLGFTPPAGATPGDLVLFVESLTNGTQNCTLRRVATAPAVVAPAVVSAGAGALTIAASAPGLPISYSKDAALYNLGPNLQAVSYTVYTDNQGHSSLIATDLTQGAAQAAFPAALAANSLVVADQVVNLQTQYGVDDGFVVGTTANDGVIDRWVDATAATGWDAASLTAVKIGQIRAIRLGIIVRSSQVERPTIGAATCPTTPTMPRALSAAATTTPVKAQSPQMDTTNMPTPTCYRYKTYETVIPIRNPIWSDANLR